MDICTYMNVQIAFMWNIEFTGFNQTRRTCNHVTQCYSQPRLPSLSFSHFHRILLADGFPLSVFLSGFPSSSPPPRKKSGNPWGT